MLAYILMHGSIGIGSCGGEPPKEMPGGCLDTEAAVTFGTGEPRGPKAGDVITKRPFRLVTGRVWKRTAFGRGRGRTEAPVR